MRVIVLASLLASFTYSFCLASPYFPIRKQSGDAGFTEFEANWYGEALGRMREPNLQEAARDPRIVAYRFTILPTWGNPIVVRAEKRGGLFRLFARSLDGQAGYDQGKLVEKKEVTLSALDSMALGALISALKFSDMPTTDAVRGFDGEEWILEGVANGKYHVIQRWSAGAYYPRERGLEPFLDVCRFLIANSTLSEPPRNKGYEVLPTPGQRDR